MKNNLREHTKKRSNVIYIAGPISGTTDYMKRFKKAEEELKSRGFIPVNPTVVSEPMVAANCEYEEFMDVTHQLLRICGAIYLLNDWENSKGTLRELEYALDNEYEVYCESSWFFHEQDICPSCGVSFCCYNYDKKAPMNNGHCPNCGEFLIPKGGLNEADLST